MARGIRRRPRAGESSGLRNCGNGLDLHRAVLQDRLGLLVAQYDGVARQITRKDF
jgi:hypothetical protein